MKKFYHHNDINPFIGCEKEIMIGKNGEYTIGYELNLPPIFTIPENVLDDLAEKFSQGIKILPNYCRIHRQDFISNETIDIAQFVGQKENPFCSTN